MVRLIGGWAGLNVAGYRADGETLTRLATGWRGRRRGGGWGRGGGLRRGARWWVSLGRGRHPRRVSRAEFAGQFAQAGQLLLAGRAETPLAFGIGAALFFRRFLRATGAQAQGEVHGRSENIPAFEGGRGIGERPYPQLRALGACVEDGLGRDAVRGKRPSRGRLAEPLRQVFRICSQPCIGDAPSAKRSRSSGGSSAMAAAWLRDDARRNSWSQSRKVRPNSDSEADCAATSLRVVGRLLMPVSFGSGARGRSVIRCRRWMVQVAALASSATLGGPWTQLLLSCFREFQID